MDEKNHISQMFRDGYRVSEIARALKRDRRTVSAFIKSPQPAVPCPIPRLRNTPSKAFESTVEDWIKNSQATRSPKDRTTAKAMYQMLKAGVDGLPQCAFSQRTFYRLYHRVMGTIKASESTRNIALTHPAGHAQLDFGELHLIIGRKQQKAYHLVLTFPQSNARFACVLPGQTFECLALGLWTIFDHIGGVPKYIRLDNMSTAVSKVYKGWGLIDTTADIWDERGHPRRMTDNFQRMALYYGFTPEFCNTAKGQEKGSVENAVGWVRNNAFPMLRNFDCSLAEITKDHVLPFCDAQLSQAHYRHRDKTIAEMFEADRNELFPLPEKAFDGATWEKRVVDNVSRISLGGSTYQVGAAAGSTVWVRKEPYRLEIYDSSRKLLSTYPRSYEPKGDFIDWEVQLEDLVAKPMAFRNSVLKEVASPASGKYLASMYSQERSQVLSVMLELLHKGMALDAILGRLDRAVVRAGGKAVSDVICLLRTLDERRTDETAPMKTPPGWEVDLPVVDYHRYEAGHA